MRIDESSFVCLEPKKHILYYIYILYVCIPIGDSHLTSKTLTTIGYIPDIPGIFLTSLLIYPVFQVIKYYCRTSHLTLTIYASAIPIHNVTSA